MYFCVFFFKQKTAYEMLRSLVGSEMCIRDRMYSGECVGNRPAGRPKKKWIDSVNECLKERNVSLAEARIKVHNMSLIHISEPTRLLSISYAVFCLKKKKKKKGKQ